MIYHKICKICGNPFESKSNRAEVCKRVHTSVCCICGKEYVMKPPYTSKTCSLRCGQQIGNLSRKRTFLERYGTDNPMKVDKFKEAARASSISKYGVDNPSKSEVVIKKISTTFQQRYGVNNAMKVKEFAQKQRDSVEQSLGVRYPIQNNEIHDKIRQTNLERYGADNPLGSEEVRSRWMEKYRKTHEYDLPIQDPGVKEKVVESCMKKYGVPYACMTPNCRSSYRTVSKINKAFGTLLEEHSMPYETEFPLKRKSFDFKINNILVEIDPTSTHNSTMSIFPDSKPTSCSYHIEKTKIAEDNGYRCIHVFDWDDWRSILELLLPRKRLHARKCRVQKVDKKTADEFTAVHHLSGKCNGQNINYGLYYDNDELVEVMTFGKPRYNKKYDLELLRLCTCKGIEVIGGASKLFHEFCKDHEDLSIISYCDLSKFTGSVYEKIGMKLSHVTSPAKIWSKGSKKITDNLLRQRGYDQLFNANYGKGTSNEQLMLEHGWLPVYDCGQRVFTYDIKQGIK